MKRLTPWLISLALLTPVILLYLAHFSVGGELQPTGFIQSDMPSYMAAAREYHDQEAFSLLYPSPFSDQADAQPIYFQLHIFLLAGLQGLLGLPPGWTFCLFGLLAGLVCMRVVVALWEDWMLVKNPRFKWLTLWAFAWGGGLLAITGIVYFGVKTGDWVEWLDHSVKFDPFDGWWFLNLGRNLIYPTEAFYHALFLGAAWAVLKRRLLLAFGCAVMLSLSHPFTGIQLLLVLSAWVGMEVLGSKFFTFGYLNVTKFLHSERPRRFWKPTGSSKPLLWFAIGVLGLMGLHLGYYLWWLPLDEGHRAVAEQWALAWTYQAHNYLPAYALVLGLVGWQVQRWALVRDLLSQPFARFCLIWAGISFLLANHEWFITPHQPLHFTRGYVWTPLFLLGAPTIASWAGRLKEALPSPLALAMVIGLGLTLLFDNTCWFLWQGQQQAAGKGQTVCLKTDQAEVLDFLAQTPHTDHLLMTEDRLIGYLTVVYTPLQSWYSHWASTPNAKEKQLKMENGEWKMENERGVFWVGRRDGKVPVDDGEVVFENGTYRIWRIWGE